MQDKRKTITFQPSADVESLLEKAVIHRVGRKATANDRRGIPTKIINEALRSQLAKFIGKRELAKAT